MTRTSVITVAVCACVAGGAGVASAQDSVSTGAGLPGDAVSAYAAGPAGSGGEQVNDYVVDLASIASSWGNRYRIGPVMKASQGGAFFTHLIGAQAVSNRFVASAFPRSAYDAWRAAGQGVSASQNAVPVDDGSGDFGPRSMSGREGSQFGVALMEFGGGANGLFGDGDDEQNVIVGLAGFEASRPGRLYVSRVVAAGNKPSAAPGLTATASLGLGGVDAAGDVHVLADGFGTSSAGAIADKRLMRVAAGSRGAGLNQLSSAGATDVAATRLLQANQVLQSTPTLIPASGAARPVLVGMDFSGAYQYEGVTGVVTGTAVWAAAGESPRGPVALTAAPFVRTSAGLESVATLAVLSETGLVPRTRGISVWGADAAGAVTGALRVELPITAGQIVDPMDGYDPAAVWGSLEEQEFTNFASQVSFRGGNGPVAMTVLPGGDLLLAAAVACSGASSAVPQGMDNFVAVARVSAASGAVSWSVAAHTGNAGGAAGGASKVILGDFGADGIPGNADEGEGDGEVDRGSNAWIGRVARYSEAVAGTSSGPSLSSPAVDRLGNLYFLASTMYKTLTGIRLSVSLVRANHNGAGEYELERLAEVGDMIAGQNSTRNYQIQYMGVADGDSVDSGAVFSGNIVQDLLPGVSTGRAGAYGSAASLGALVVRCKIVYDFNNDGEFRDPTVAGNGGSPDQAYVAAMIVMPQLPGRADFNGDGFVNPDDLSDFITCFFLDVQFPGSCAEADFNGDGFRDPDDLSDFITVFFSI